MNPRTAQALAPPPAERLATRLDVDAAAEPTTAARAGAATALRELGGVDLAVYRAVAEAPTPTLDRPVRRLSAAADRSRLWLGVAGAMAVLGGRPGRRAAAAGLAAIAVSSVVVNGFLKIPVRRGRPDRDSARVPIGRRVHMPGSASWPSGHSASGFAFANAVGQTVPAAGLPMRMLASAVGYSRVHTGVHYPGDVVMGAVIGASVGEAVGWGLSRMHPDPRLRSSRRQS
jgi:membrane-associated phospholipid phosphatase